MGRRGPQPKPTALRVLEGRVQHRALPAGEVMPTIEMPRCPDFLKGDARSLWTRLAPRLHRLGLLSELDAEQLTMLASCWQRWRQAEEDVAQSLELTGHLDRFRVLVANRYLAHFNQLAANFGLSPAARSRLSLGDRAAAATADSDGVLS